MIKHIVLWKLKDFAEGATKQQNALKIKAMLEDMLGKIPGMLKLEVGLNFEKSSDAADISLYTEFESREALDAYQIHPAHMPAKKIIPLVRMERRVADYEA
jgi:Stress responsive A/B Barrel Domain.